MIASLSGTKPNPKILVFGPQALTFDVGSFNKLRSQLQETPRYGWILRTVAELPSEWNNLSSSITKLQYLNGKKVLEDLNEWLRGDEIPQSSFPLPNILLSPLTVIAQLTQHSAFLKAAFPDLPDKRELPKSIQGSTETLGLCTGTLSAFAAAYSSSQAELQHHGEVAVRLAMLVGALVDAAEVSPDCEGKSTSISASWNSGESRDTLNEVLENFLEAYTSVSIDERRATVTTSKETAPALIQQLKSNGIHVAEVPLYGRFHWPKHGEDVEQLIRFCDANPTFQFPDVSKMVLFSRLPSSGQYVTNGKPHEIALRAILLEHSQWYKAFNAIYSSQLTSSNTLFICLGPERCVPPTIARKLGSQLTQVSDVDPTTSSLPGHLLDENRANDLEDLPDERIAVIGMACQAPGAEDLEDFWKILRAGQSQHKEIPADRFGMKTIWREYDPNRKWYGNFIQDYDTFDHKFFKKSPREMASTDPQHRLALQIAYQAVEQSGYWGASFDKHIGCFMGVGNVDYENNVTCYPATAYSATGNLKSFLAGKISHYFGWTGPSLTLDTACSSSSVAIHQACRAILSGECTAALAGGVNIITHPDWYYNLDGAAFLSSTGQCKPFDAKADGYCRGEGVGAVFLKKLSSAIAGGDQVLGVIASTRVYQNQNCTAITVPNVVSLSKLFQDVVRQARLEPKMVSVVEAHGTGTPVGDPAEFNSIRSVFGGSIRSDILSLSSVKGLIGHTECASGVVSLVKILLMIQQGSIPPQASFNSINPSLDATSEDRIEVPTRLKPWDVEFRAALINNYGASGSNASMVVTEAPKIVSRDSSRLLMGKSFPFWFCGLDEQGLSNYIAKFRRFLQCQATSGKELSVSNLSFQVSRQSNHSLPRALIFDARSSTELEQKLAAFEKSDKSIQLPSTRPVILCFGGQISTYVGLDEEVYENVAIFRSYLDQCNAMCLSLGLDSIYPDIFQRSPIQDIVKLQTALFATQYSCAKAWLDSGVKVAAVVGHSFGELTALCFSNAVSLEDAIKMVSGRARIIQNNWGVEKGSMMAAEADLADVEALLTMSQKAFGSRAEIAIACYNGPTNFTLAGSVKAIQLIENIASNDPEFRNVKLKKLNVSNAFHSPLVDTLTGDLERLGQDLVFSEPDIRFERATEQRYTEKLDARFLADHMRKPVFFNHAVQRLANEYPEAIWLEAGSNSTVTTMASRALALSSSSFFQSVNITSDNSFQLLVDTTTKLWRQGLNVSFWAHHPVQLSQYTPVLLPPYQFEKSKHWLDLKKPPKLVAPVLDQPQIQSPKDLTTFVGYQGEGNRSARFQVNTKTDKYNRLMSGHIMAGTGVVCPGMFQLEIAIHALTSLRPDFQNLSFQPQLQGMEHYQPLPLDASKLVWVDAESSDTEGLVWNWKLIATEMHGPKSTHYTSGTIVFRPANDPRREADFEQLARFTGRKRSLRLLETSDAEDVLQGRNIYRAFAEVIDYKEIYRHVTKIVGKDTESAGRVVKTCDKASWLDSVLTDCFCQVAGIFVNLMTDKSDLSESGIFICNAIKQWTRSPKMGSGASLPDVWEVFALHHRASDNQYISDVFVFDPRDGSLVEVILGISYQKVAMGLIRKILSTSSPSGLQLSTPTAKPAPAKTQAPAPLPGPAFTSVPGKAAQENNQKATKRKPKTAGPDVAGKTREIICNLSGLEPDEIKEDSDLIELGIDSLMSMELTREVDSAFHCTLEDEQLMALTDFQSLVACIRSTLGLGCQEKGDASVAENSSEGEEGDEPTANGIVHLANGMIGVNGMNGVANGVSSPVKDTSLPASTVLDAFREAKEATDDFIVKGGLSTYYSEFMPRSTELCIVYILNAFEDLGCPIRSAAPGQKLERIPYLPKHQQLVDLIYELLRKEGRLIEINGSEIIRSAVSPPSKSAEDLLQELLHNEPIHAAENKLTSLIGLKFADCLTGKVDGLQLVFGTPEGREYASDVYAKSPINAIWIQQAEFFIEKLTNRLAKNGEPLRILEMGAGTGGTTSKMIPLLARLGIPVEYTMTDLSSSLVTAGRKRFKQYPFMKFKVVNIESEPEPQLLRSQHIVLATNCVHATRNLTISTTNIHKILRPDGFLLLLEMMEQVPWVDFIFGLLEGWWLFEDGRRHALSPATYWEKVLSSVGFGHVDWTEGSRPEANIQRLIIALASGPRYDRVPKPLSHPAQTALTDTTGRQTVIDAYVDEYTKDFRAPSESTLPHDSPSAGPCVLVTGATGSLGSHIVACLAQLSDVHTVVCLNRLSTTEATTRQQNSLRSKGISLDATSMSKLKVLETDSSKPMLGLSTDTYNTLVKTVTHIVHNAWPMSITRPIRAYESQFKVMQGLINLGREATAWRPASFKFSFQFISSIGVVGYRPFSSGKALAPEKSMTAASVLPVGYADAKLVCERMLDETMHRYSERFRPMAVRIGQIAGSTSTGYWNSSEFLAFLIKSSQSLNVLPDLDGTLSWCPVDDVSATLHELLMSDRTPHPIYHIENPSRQPWKEMVTTLANALDIPRDGIIQFEEWADRVRCSPASTTDNPAGQLGTFYSKHFVRMSCGGLILDTTKTREHSETLRKRGILSDELVMKYITAWKEAGFLNL